MEYRIHVGYLTGNQFVEGTTAHVYRPTLEGLKELRRRVQNGIAFLTKYKGRQWDKGIDLSRLEMQSGCRCIAGQSFKDFCEYDDGFHALLDGKAKDPKTGALVPRTSAAQLRELGFYTSTEDPMVQGVLPSCSNILYGWLGDVWKAEIIAKRRRERRNLVTG